MSTILIVLVLLGVGLLFYAVVLEPHFLELEEVDVPIGGLPPEFDGFTISVLSDLHQTPGDTIRTVRRAVAMALDARPDVILLLGDYGPSAKLTPHFSRWLYARSMRALTPALSPLRAPDGVYAVVGNHDYYGSVGAVINWLGSIGARPLVNESVRIVRGAATLAIGGVADAVEGRVDPNGGCGEDDDMGREVTIVMSHNPDGVLALRGKRRIDLVLSGHTHGGQVVFPVIGAPITNSVVCRRHTASGWVPNPRAPLYVSRGVGTQTPIRFLCRPEVTVVRLRRA